MCFIDSEIFVPEVYTATARDGLPEFAEFCEMIGSGVFRRTSLISTMDQECDR